MKALYGPVYSSLIGRDSVLSQFERVRSGQGNRPLLKGDQMSNKDRGQKSTKKPAAQTLKEKRAAKRGKTESESSIINKKK